MKARSARSSNGTRTVGSALPSSKPRFCLPMTPLLVPRCQVQVHASRLPCHASRFMPCQERLWQERGTLLGREPSRCGWAAIRLPAAVTTYKIILGYRIPCQSRSRQQVADAERFDFFPAVEGLDQTCLIPVLCRDRADQQGYTARTRPAGHSNEQCADASGGQE